MPDVNVTVGHTVTCTIEYLDTAGNPMLVAPVVDSTQWIQPDTNFPSTETAGSLVVSCPIAGNVLVDCTVVVGGVPYAADQIHIIVAPQPQILGSIRINTEIS